MRQGWASNPARADQGQAVGQSDGHDRLRSLFDPERLEKRRRPLDLGQTVFRSQRLQGQWGPEQHFSDMRTQPLCKRTGDGFWTGDYDAAGRTDTGAIDGQITASGTTTKSGETVLVYHLPMADRVGTQYYIVGEQRYVLVYETNVDGSDECDAAARHMVKSFKWAP